MAAQTLAQKESIWYYSALQKQTWLTYLWAGRCCHLEVIASPPWKKHEKTTEEAKKRRRKMETLNPHLCSAQVTVKTQVLVLKGSHQWHLFFWRWIQYFLSSWPHALHLIMRRISDPKAAALRLHSNPERLESEQLFYWHEHSEDGKIEKS